MPIPGFPVGDGGDGDGMPQRSGGSSLQRRSAGQDSLSAPLILQPDPPPPENKWVVESLLFFVMGMSGWWTINAIQWAESPIFVERTPERQAITNLLMVTCQIGNVFPFVYKGVFSKQTQARILPASIMVCQIIAIATGIVVALGWQVTVELPDGGRHSIVLLLCTVVAGGVGTLSNVTYWALCTRYDGSHCTSAMSTGMAVGGVISSGAALIQQPDDAGNDDKPLFSVEIFMLAVAAIQTVFMIAFVFILQHPPGETDDAAQPPNPSSSDDTGKKLTPKAAMGARTASRAGLGSSATLHVSDGTDSPLDGFPPDGTSSGEGGAEEGRRDGRTSPPAERLQVT